jgi:FkbM family methyltransferase
VGVFGKAVRAISPNLHGYISSVIDGGVEAFPPRRIFASKPIHRKLKAMFSSRPGFFIEAGANNGIRGSNTYYLEKHYGWTGLLIEAIPHRFVECKQARPGSTSVHCGLVSPDYPDRFVELVYMDMMSMVRSNDGAVDMDAHMAENIATNRYNDELIGTTFFAPARTLASVLAEHGNPSIDLFSLDVEGHELDVLKGHNWDQCSPAYILIEDWDKDGVAEFLTAKGYVVHHRFGEQDALYRFTQPRTSR